MRPVDPRLVAHATTARWHLAAAVSLGLVTAALVIAQATVVGMTLADVFAGRTDTIARAALTVAAIGCGRAATAWATEVSAHRASASVKSELRRTALARITQLGPTWVSRTRTSDVATSLVSGLDALDPYFARYLPSLVLAIAVPAAGTAWILRYDLLSAVIVALTLPLVPFFMVLVGKVTESEVDRQWRGLQALAGHFLDLVTGVTTLKAFNRSSQQTRALQASGEEYRIATMRVLRVSFLSALVLELIATVAVALVAVSIGLRLDMGEFTLAHGLVILILVPEVYLPLRNVGTHFHAAAAGTAAVQQVLDIIQTPPLARHDGILTAGPCLTLEFRDVTVTYPGAASPALKSFDALLRSGELTVVQGPSGCGKTTALSLLMRFLDSDSGTVLVDGTDICHIETASLRSVISYLPQTPWLPYGTLREALCASGEYPEEQIVDACRRAGLDVTELPAGLDSRVSRRAGLSAGQRRRVALARLLLAPGRIVLLDEPTASVDAAAEHTIVETARALAAEGRLVVLVSHREAAASSAQNVITMSTSMTGAA